MSGLLSHSVIALAIVCSLYADLHCVLPLAQPTWLTLNYLYLCVCVFSLHVWLIWHYGICILVCVLTACVTDMTVQYLYPCVCALTTCVTDTTIQCLYPPCVYAHYMWLIWQYSICILVCVLTTYVTDVTIQCLYPCVCAHYMCDWYHTVSVLPLCIC